MNHSKFKKAALWLLVLILGVWALTLGVQAYVGGSPKVVVEGDYIEAPLIDAPSETVFGGTVNPFPEDFPEGIKVDTKFVIDGSGYFVGDKGRRTEGEYRISFSEATTSAVQLLSKNIYVYDAYFVPTGVPTTSIQVLFGTSTAAFVSNDTVCGVNGTCGNATAGEASILKTGNFSSADTATSTPFFKADFQGTDTRDGSGTRFVVPVNSGKYLTVYASSSVANLDDITGNSNLFAGYGVVKYFILTD